jgi:hypothetical protein
VAWIAGDEWSVVTRENFLGCDGCEEKDKTVENGQEEGIEDGGREVDEERRKRAEG